MIHEGGGGGGGDSAPPPDRDPDECCPPIDRLNLAPVPPGTWNTTCPFAVSPTASGPLGDPRVAAVVRQCAHSFEAVLKFLAEDVFHINPASVNMFLDAADNVVAFNYQGALHFNLRYFMQSHLGIKLRFDGAAQPALDDLLAAQPPSVTDTVLASWFMTMCHELAHNGCKPHNRDFARCMQDVATSKLFPLMAALTPTRRQTMGTLLTDCITAVYSEF